MGRRIQLFDTTLRDGNQAEGVSLSVDDKVRIALRLDDLGVDYIEGGWPSANPTDVAFFARMREAPLRHARLVAFASTRRASLSVEEDPQVQGLLAVKTPVVAIMGKSWLLHCTRVLRVTADQNLQMIADTISYAKRQGREVVYDAEHYFDAYADDPGYALATLRAAHQGGADVLCLCDTNGGSIPETLTNTIAATMQALPAQYGIHAHNDGDLAVANTLAAVGLGVSHIQGTVNGYGERCGNANLCSIIANLQLKAGIECIPTESLGKLYSLSHFVAEIANLNPPDRQPFVGRSAFAHKGGVHADAVLKCPQSYEHISPELVGNRRRFLVSDQSGGSAVLTKVGHLAKLTKDSPQTKQIVAKLKEKEHQGYQYEAAEASFELLVQRMLKKAEPLFRIESFRVIVEEREREPVAEATIKLQVGDQMLHTVAEGDGPVHALDGALRKALQGSFPELDQMRLSDFKVRVVNTGAGTAAKVRVLVESADHLGFSWTTVGVHENIVAASLEALADGIEYGLLKHRGLVGNDSRPAAA